MAKFPVEIIRIGEKYHDEITDSISLINNIQNHFEITLIDSKFEEDFKILNYRDVFSDLLMSKLYDFKNKIKGFYPFKIFITDSRMKIPNIEESSLFGEADGREGLAVFTTFDVPNTIIPEDRMNSYFVYFIGRYILNFLHYDHRNHEETRGCVFDYKGLKTDITQSMRPNAICDECREILMSPTSIMSSSMFDSLN